MGLIVRVLLLLIVAVVGGFGAPAASDGSSAVQPAAEAPLDGFWKAVFRQLRAADCSWCGCSIFSSVLRTRRLLRAWGVSSKFQDLRRRSLPGSRRPDP